MNLTRENLEQHWNSSVALCLCSPTAWYEMLYSFDSPFRNAVVRRRPVTSQAAATKTVQIMGHRRNNGCSDLQKKL